MKTLNIIGAGKLGKILGKNIIEKNNLKLSCVLNKNFENSKNAVSFFNSGKACENYKDLEPASIWMISVPDDEIHKVISKLLEINKIREGDIIFHCSGSLSSKELFPLKEDNIYIASIHPIKSFINNEKIESLSGVYCSIEGDKEALKILTNILSQIGFTTFEIKAEDKMFFHAGCVFTCNYLTTLFDIGLNCFKNSGVDEKLAKKIISPLIKETVNNNLNLSSLDALTGPIKRGDYNLVKEQLAKLKGLDSNIYNAYKILGKATLEILKTDEGNEDIKAIDKLFE